jgi:hypothetical protein
MGRFSRMDRACPMWIFAIGFGLFSMHFSKIGNPSFSWIGTASNQDHLCAALSGASWRSFCTARLAVLSIPSSLVDPWNKESQAGVVKRARGKTRVKIDATLLLSFS